MSAPTVVFRDRPAQRVLLDGDAAARRSRTNAVQIVVVERVGLPVAEHACQIAALRLSSVGCVPFLCGDTSRSYSASNCVTVRRPVAAASSPASSSADRSFAACFPVSTSPCLRLRRCQRSVPDFDRPHQRR